MPIMGFDAAQDCSHVIDKIKASPAKFVARYYSYNQDKNLTPSEAHALSEAGLALVTVWEAQGDRYSAFTAAQGAKDATTALLQAASCGQPEGTTIYFAVDFDADEEETDGGVVDYFGAVNRVFNASYNVGVYGSGLVANTLRSLSLAEYFWLGGAMGWRGSRNFTGAHIKQMLPTTKAPWNFGFEVDPDTALVDDYGQWPLAEPQPQPAPAPQLNPIAQILSNPNFIAGVKAFQHATGLREDGVIGPITLRKIGDMS